MCEPLQWNVAIPTVNPSLVTFQKENCMFLWGLDRPPTPCMTQHWVSVCGPRRGVGSGLFMAGWGAWVVFEHLWTASLLFISVLMACCSPALRLCWLDVRLCWFQKSLVPFYSRDWSMSSIQMSRNARLKLPILTVCDLSAFPAWDCFVVAWISLQPYIRWNFFFYFLFTSLSADSWWHKFLIIVPTSYRFDIYLAYLQESVHWGSFDATWYWVILGGYPARAITQLTTLTEYLTVHTTCTLM